MKISNFKLGLATPLSYDRVPSAFFESFLLMSKPPFHYLRCSSGPIDEMRNEIVREALVSGITHLMMFDTDQIYETNTITRLLSHKKDVVGCMVCRRYPPFDPLMLRGSISRYKTITEWSPGELVEVDATGTGCLMFNMEVFRKMPEPWFNFRKSDDGSPIGEDIGFCSDLRAAGYQIYVDTGCPAGHLSQMVVNEHTWRLYRRLKEEQVRAAHEADHGVVKTVNA
jgi:hypothetical protein